MVQEGLCEDPCPRLLPTPAWGLGLSEQNQPGQSDPPCSAPHPHTAAAVEVASSCPRPAWHINMQSKEVSRASPNS